VSVNLGYTPQPLTVTLVRGSGFASSLIASAPWPTGAVISLVFDPGHTDAITWTAAVADVTAAWQHTADDVGAVLDLDPRAVLLQYSDASGVVVPWARGSVNAL
jgi:hypothetical protein